MLKMTTKKMSKSPTKGPHGTSARIQFMQTHRNFEEAARRLGVKHRLLNRNAQGAEQHVVHVETGGLLRWPVWYESGSVS